MKPRGIILAAGRGSRMNSLTDDRPKCLVEFRGKALLDWQIDALSAAGVTEIGIVTGYSRELLADRGLFEFHNERWATTNMVSSLECAAEWLASDRCIVSYSDIFYSAASVWPLLSAPSDLAVTYDPNWLSQWSKRFANPLDDAETFRVDESGYLLEIGGVPTRTDEVTGQYMGLLSFRPMGWAGFEHMRSMVPTSERDKMHMTGALARLIGVHQMRVRAIPVFDDWGEIDTMSDLHSLE